MTDVSMRILLSAQDGASSVIRGVGSVLSSLPGPMGAIAGVGLAVGAAVIGIGVASVGMAAQYQQSMLKVQSLTGSSNQQMAQYNQGIMQLAVNAGVAPKALADGLYNVISAGYQGSGAMKVLTLATEDAKIGMTDSTTTTQALTNVMANFKVGVAGANVVNGEMLETVTLGKASFSQYANSITKAASTSAQYGENMQTMNAAWATLTASGISAGQATTDYDQSLKVMDGNIGKVATSLHSNGIAFDETKFNAMSYGQKVVYLNSALQQARDKHVAITGATVQATQAIKTISDHIGVYNSDLKTLSDKNAMANKTQQAWAITQQGFSQTMSRVSAAVQVAMINIGSKLLPILTKTANSLIPLITGFSNWLVKSGALDTAASLLTTGISGLVSIISHVVSAGVGLTNFFTHNQTAMNALKAVVIGVGAALGVFALTQVPVMVGALSTWAAAQIPVMVETLATAAPYLLIGALVAAVVFGIIEVVEHWGAISKALEVAWNTSLHAIGGFFSWLGSSIHQILSNIGATIGGFFSAVGARVHAGLTAIQNFFAAAWAWIQAAARVAFVALIMIIIGPIGDLIVLIITHWTQIQSFLSSTWSTIQSLASSAWNTLTSTISSIVSNLVSNVVNFFQQLPGRAVSAVTGLAGQLAGFFQGLASQALGWGADLIQNIASGIMGAIGSVISAVGNVASAITSHLHFSLPDEGPLAQADQWMPDMMQLFATGIQNGAPLIQNALNTGLALPVANTMSGLGAGGSDTGVLADQLSFAQAPTEIYSGKKAPVRTTAEKKREAAQLKSAEKTDAAEFKAIDAEIAAIKKRESAKLKQDQKASEAEIKAIEARDKGLRGSAKKAEEAEIKSIREREKNAIASDRKSFNAKIAADKKKEKQLKQEIHLHLTVNATKLDASEVDKLSQQVIKKFGDQIRAQFANI